MIEKSTIENVLEIFFIYPSREFHLRELSRLLKLSMPTIIVTTDTLAKNGMVLKTKEKPLTKVKANREKIEFIRRKRVYNLGKIYDLGLVDFLSRSYNYPANIILFGSFSRGEDIETSDIDIAVTTSRKLSLNLEKYSKILNRSISVHEIEIGKVSNDFKINLYNGIVLEGSL